MVLVNNGMSQLTNGPSQDYIPVVVYFSALALAASSATFLLARLVSAAHFKRSISLIRSSKPLRITAFSRL